MFRTGSGMTSRVLVVLLGLGMLLGFSIGCSQKESFTPYLNGGLQTDTLFVYGTVANPSETSASLGKSAGGMWKSGQLIVCNWRGYHSRCFLGFSGLPDTSVQVTDATLFLYATRIEGAAETGSFGVYALADTLDEDNVTWNNMPDLGARVATFSPHRLGEDSVTVDVKDIVSAWVKGKIVNMGFAIKLEDELTSEQAIVEFGSREDASTRITDEGDTVHVWPTLRIAYIAYVDTAGEAKFTEVTAAEDTFADTLTVPLSDTLLAVANGFPTRTFLKFDVSGLPPAATITRAMLRLTAAMGASSFEEMTLVCHAVVDSVISGFDIGYGTKGSEATVLTKDELASDSSFALLVTPLVQPLVSGLVAHNYGLVIKSSDETVDLDFIVLVPARDGNPEFAPRLEVEYLKPPLPWYWRD